MIHKRDALAQKKIGRNLREGLGPELIPVRIDPLFVKLVLETAECALALNRV